MIVNTQDECVVGGQREEVESAVRNLGCHFHQLHGVTTVHCEVAQVVAGPYRDLHLLDTDTSVPVRFYSGAAGSAYALSRDAAADSILEQALHGVDYPAVIERAYADGVRIFLEMGPGSSCTRMIRSILAGRPVAVRSVCAAGQDGAGAVLPDPYSVIEHAVGAGIGAYGMITGNEDALPSEGSAITLSVAVAEK